jgi:hypothetical protein
MFPLYLDAIPEARPIRGTIAFPRLKRRRM